MTLQRIALIAAAFAVAAGAAGSASAQGQPVQQGSAPPISSQPVPGELELSKLLWTTMAAIDHANQAGNYSVLRDISAPAFQINNDAAALTSIFQGVRSSRVDLSNALLVAPTYTQAPRILPGEILQVQGYFGLRPTIIQFDLQFQWVQGRWKMFGVGIRPTTMAQTMPGPAPAPPPTRNQPTRQQQRN